MAATRENKYKECMPEETVNRIKGILDELGILLEEHWEDTGIEGFYTLRINVPGTGLGSNGKGATREYAQASAYAEFMERLQNDCLRLGDYDEDTWAYKGFYHTPDEKLMSAAEMADSDNALVKLLLKSASEELQKGYGGNVGMANLMAMWHMPLSSEPDGRFAAVRYYSVRDKRYEYLPYAICMKLYGSNGMCAGNTAEEALVQGVSEIFERHVNLKVVRERLKLPTIPDWYLSKYERLHGAIKDIEGQGRYKVLVKDGSLGRGYPVVVLIIIDKERQSYGVRFGAHPDFEIALERTLSEAFQGKNIGAFTGLSTLRLDNAGLQYPDNITNIAKAGLGQYPAELFDEAADYEFTPFENITGKSNREELKDMLEIITSQGYDVMIKDASYLNFPAFHVISPGFSEIHSAELQKVREVHSSLVVRNALRKLYHASEEELREIAYYLKFKQYSINENTFSTLVGVGFRDKYKGGELEHYFLIGACLYKLGIYKEAAVVFELVANGMHGANEKTYCRCITDYAAGAAEGRSADQIEGILGLLYPEDIAKLVCMQMERPGEIMEKFYPNISCFNCSKCGARSNCCYDTERCIKRILKDRQSKAVLNDLSELEI